MEGRIVRVTGLVIIDGLPYSIPSPGLETNVATLAAREAEERPQAEVARTASDPSYAATHSGYYNRLAIGS